ncbi:orotidine-5'-phosphate decarboxylase [Deinococcus roseus]|uniref:Orotidine 5'-phosphate decarboxylase n=1 Tax=Deinococcus roseus TaxID=392414 RepID=A0ABQ2CZA7_9DEIO|nr:orotidine 5'-phosphate decarboxylase [Deinococcus roseus]
MFQQRLRERSEKQNTRLCLGLDPRLAAHGSFEQMKRQTLAVLEGVAPHAACVKPQAAFYEAMGLQGIEFMIELMRLARTLDLPVLLDAKRGDIGSTAEAYAQAWMTGEHAGNALTVNPYLGFETLRPFVDAGRKNGGGVFVLVKTSNPGSKDLQDLSTPDGLLAEVVAKALDSLGAEEGEGLSSVGAVVGATHPAELKKFRDLMPRATLLLPGLGAQGAKAEDLVDAFHEDGSGAVVSASRGIQYASADLGVEAAVQAAIRFKDQLNQAAQK